MYNEKGFLLTTVSKNNGPINIYPDDKGLDYIVGIYEKIGPLITGDRYGIVSKK